MIAPGYYRHDPPAPLGRYVDHFWILERFPAARAERLLPDGTAELIFNLGVTQRLYDDDLTRFRPFREAWFSGPRRSAITIGSPCETTMVGVHFRPLGAFAFFDTPMSSFADRVLDLDAVWGRAAVRIRDRLGEAKSIDERFRVVADELTSRLRRDVRSERAVRHAISAFESDDVSNGETDRTLRRSFHELVGLSPKLTQRLLRFQRILARIEHPGPVNWTALALAEGLYDQSHLVREFREFAGLTPTEYLTKKGPYPNALSAA